MHVAAARYSVQTVILTEGQALISLWGDCVTLMPHLLSLSDSLMQFLDANLHARFWLVRMSCGFPPLTEGAEDALNGVREDTVKLTNRSD